MHSKKSESMQLEEMERALANYDAMIRILKKQMEEGTNSAATPEVIAQFQQWRDHLGVRIGVERTRRLRLEDAKAPNAVRSAEHRIREYWNDGLPARWARIFVVAAIIIGLALAIVSVVRLQHRYRRHADVDGRYCLGSTKCAHQCSAS